MKSYLNRSPFNEPHPEYADIYAEQTRRFGGVVIGFHKDVPEANPGAIFMLYGFGFRTARPATKAGLCAHVRSEQDSTCPA